MENNVEVHSLKLDTNTILSIERTRLSHDRTANSAVRTATSLISFGFTIYKFFQLEIGGHNYSNYFLGPRGFGITMIVIGLASLAVATVEYRKSMVALRKLYPEMPRSFTGLISAFIALLGILALSAAILRQ